MLRGVRSNTVSKGDKALQGAEIENMEGATLFAVAPTLGVRCVEIRSISNRVGEDFALWCVAPALENLAHTLKSLFVD